ncbi:MAG: SPFH domain-containing protein [Gemmatales bacterium]
MNDRTLRLASGWTGLLGIFAGLGLIALLVVVAVIASMPMMLWLIIPLALVWFLSLFGFIVVNPNQACVVQLFGQYVGTVSEVGFYYGNPFYWRTNVSLRVRTFETGVQESEEVKDATGKVVKSASQSRRPIKVNDKDGTPIEIGAVVVWKVIDAAQAVFQVDDYDSYVHTQADAALRNLASHYRYDAPEDDVSSLRGHIDLVAEKLKVELHTRMH